MLSWSYSGLALACTTEFGFQIKEIRNFSPLKLGFFITFIYICQIRDLK